MCDRGGQKRTEGYIPEAQARVTEISFAESGGPHSSRNFRVCEGDMWYILCLKDIYEVP